MTWLEIQADSKTHVPSQIIVVIHNLYPVNKSQSESKETIVEYNNGASEQIRFIGTIKIAYWIWNFKMARRTKKLILMAFAPKLECPRTVSAVKWNMSMGFKEQTQQIMKITFMTNLNWAVTFEFGSSRGSNGEKPIH
jgi:hypothetical protein